MTDQDFIKKAIEFGREGMLNRWGGPFGALIVKDGDIIGYGCNQVTSTNDPTAHAEIMAIKVACHDTRTFSLEGCTIYSSCEPCPMCLGAIYWARIKRIVCAANRFDASTSGFDDSVIYKEISLRPDQRKIPIEFICEKEGLDLLNEWTKLENKKLY